MGQVKDDPRAGAPEWRPENLITAIIPEIARIITSDSHLRQILDSLRFYAAAQLPVLIIGEPGTGKELVAEALWALSPRRRQPFLRTNCGALTESLASSELFGHLSGSFTDARHHRPGRFKLAHRGTLFLDEIGDLPLTVQPRLLRAVEQGEIEPVGGDIPLKVDVWVIAATNQDLPRLVAQGRFRQDLYDRLAVLVIHLSPLRDRGEDVLLLGRHFAREAAKRYRPDAPIRFSCAAMRRLQQYPWPGNVRELKNVITRAVLFCQEPFIQKTDLVFTPNPSVSPLRCRSLPEQPPRPAPSRLQELIQEEQGNISALARRLEVCNKTIYRWLKSYELDLSSIRDTAAG
jgi:DNA-binding NtrC family response regulator